MCCDSFDDGSSKYGIKAWKLRKSGDDKRQTGASYRRAFADVTTATVANSVGVSESGREQGVDQVKAPLAMRADCCRHIEILDGFNSEGTKSAVFN